MLRLFVGFGLPPELKLRLSLLSSGVPGARWVDPGNYHVTLRFIGEVDEGMASDIDAALAQIRAPRFALELAGVGQWGMRSLWVGVERNPALKPDELRAMLTKTARDIGSPGRDDQFGAGEADAYAAVKAAMAMQPAPVALSGMPPAGTPGKNTPEQRQNPPIQAVTPPASAIAADKPANDNADPSGNR